ncbi:unnamed protein product [Mucor fragilis]
MLSRIAIRSKSAVARLPTQRLVTQQFRQPTIVTKPFVRFQHTTKPALAKLAPLDTFPRRHLGSESNEVKSMLNQLGVKNIDEMLAKTIPSAIRSPKPLSIPEGVPERQLLARLKDIASKTRSTAPTLAKVILIPLCPMSFCVTFSRIPHGTLK